MKTTLLIIIILALSGCEETIESSPNDISEKYQPEYPGGVTDHFVDITTTTTMPEFKIDTATTLLTGGDPYVEFYIDSNNIIRVNYRNCTPSEAIDLLVNQIKRLSEVKECNASS